MKNNEDMPMSRIRSLHLKLSKWLTFGANIMALATIISMQMAITDRCRSV
jgi:hypothetical protein